MSTEHLGQMGAPWRLDRVEPCRHVFEGEGVFAVFDGKPVRATVLCSAGHHARVEHNGDARWRNVSDLARARTEEPKE